MSFVNTPLNVPLPKPLRTQLENTVKAARDVAEKAGKAALAQLAVNEAKTPSYLSTEQKALRRRLRAHGRALGNAQRAELTRAHHLQPLQPVELATPEQLQDALDACNLNYWTSKTQALSTRFDTTCHSCVQLLRPNVVHATISKCMLNDEVELKTWLVDIKALIAAKLKTGPVRL